MAEATEQSPLCTEEMWKRTNLAASSCLLQQASHASVSSKCLLPETIPAGCGLGQQRSPVAPSAPAVVAGMSGKRMGGVFLCSAPTHHRGCGSWVLLSQTPPALVWQEEIHTGAHAHDGWTDGPAHGAFPAQTPTSSTSFSSQPCFGFRLVAWKVLSCLQSTQ